jgi:hypothetical protein
MVLSMEEEREMGWGAEERKIDKGEQHSRINLQELK